MANKVKSKGSVLQMSISAVYTTIPLLKSISVNSRESTTWNSTTLDGGVTETHDPTGYATAAVITADGFHDPDDTTQAAYIALIVAPVATNFKVITADATPLERVYSGVGFGFDFSANLNDGLSCSYKIQTSGNPS